MPDTKRTSYQDRLKKAHETGHLFVHMFEDSLEGDGPEAASYPLKNLFDVMAKKPDAIYKNKYEHEFLADEQHGIKGLATTALKREYPVSLYIIDSSVGLMMDSAKPILVNPSDGYTKVSPTDITFSIRDDVKEHFQSVFDAQKISEDMIFPAITLSNNTMTNRFELAEKGLQALWQRLGATHWDDAKKIISKQGMNEVNIAANLNDVCGIIVHKNQAAIDHPQELTPIYRPFSAAVRAAVDLKAYLIKNYPEFFDTSLPIVSYEISRSQTEPKPKMEILGEQKIQEILSGKGIAKT